MSELKPMAQITYATMFALTVLALFGRNCGRKKERTFSSTRVDGFAAIKNVYHPGCSGSILHVWAANRLKILGYIHLECAVGYSHAIFWSLPMPALALRASFLRCAAAVAAAS